MSIDIIAMFHDVYVPQRTRVATKLSTSVLCVLVCCLCVRRGVGACLYIYVSASYLNSRLNLGLLGQIKRQHSKLLL